MPHHFSQRRHLLLATALLTGLPGFTGLAHAAALSPSARSAMVAFDGLYIPALFLTGSAGKSTEAAAKATAAMQRLREQWPARRAALASVAPGQRLWARALDTVQHHLQTADVQVTRADWAASHETLEHVREALFEARHALGLNHPLDLLTAYHGAMEKLANATAVDRPAMAADFAVARAHWRRIEAMSWDPATLGLTAARAAQWTQAKADESAALSRLSQALRDASDADLLKAAAAIKPPFVRGYVSFGWAPGETPDLPG